MAYLFCVCVSWVVNLCVDPSAFCTRSQDSEALVMEIAIKHDDLSRIRRELNQLEEQLKAKDSHIAFKDNIVRDLRKEIRKVCVIEAVGL